MSSSQLLATTQQGLLLYQKEDVSPSLKIVLIEQSRNLKNNGKKEQGKK